MYLIKTFSVDTIRSGMWLSASYVFNNATFKIYAYESTEESQYEKHQSQSAIMPIQQEMLDGDYIDDVEHHEWGKLVLTGNDFNYLV